VVGRRAGSQNATGTPPERRDKAEIREKEKL